MQFLLVAEEMEAVTLISPVAVAVALLPALRM
jgi:hypothetical protein